MNTDDTPPGLAIAYVNGMVQLMKNDNDEEPFVFNSQMRIKLLRWNPTGTYIAIAGTKMDKSQRKFGVISFYNNQGVNLRTLVVPNSENVDGISWDGIGLKLVIALGSSIYFADIKPYYKWGYMTDTVVFGYQKEDRIDFCVIFYNVKTGQQKKKYIKNLK